MDVCRICGDRVNIKYQTALWFDESDETFYVVHSGCFEDDQFKQRSGDTNHG